MSFPQTDAASSVRPPHVEWYTVRASSPGTAPPAPASGRPPPGRPPRPRPFRRTPGLPRFPRRHMRDRAASRPPDGVRPHGHRHRRERLRVEPLRGLPTENGGDVRLQRHHGDGEQFPFPREYPDPAGHFPVPDAQVRRPCHVEGVAEEPRPVPPDPFPDRGQGDTAHRFGDQPPVGAPRPDRPPFEDDFRRPSRQEHTDEPDPRHFGGRCHDGAGTRGDPRLRRRRAGGSRDAEDPPAPGSRGGAPRIRQGEDPHREQGKELHHSFGGAGVTIFAICMNGVSRSIGTGKMVVELFSAATSRSVWR